jgi:hypothetical protein
MKKFIALLLIAFAPLSLANTISQSQYDEVVSLLTQGVSKAMYLNDQCDMQINKEQVREVAKLFTFKESLPMPTNIDWASIATSSRLVYQSYAAKYPHGSQCEKLLEQIDGVSFLIEQNHSLNARVAPRVQLEINK